MRQRTLLHHLIRIVIAYCAAALVAGLVIAFSFGGLAPQGFETVPEHFGGLVDLALTFLFPWIVLTAAPASALAIALTEWKRLRHVFYFAAAGLVCGAGLAAGFLPGLAVTDIVLYGIAGALAGVVYWGIAGRHAGLRRHGNA